MRRISIASSAPGIAWIAFAAALAAGAPPARASEGPAWLESVADDATFESISLSGSSRPDIERVAKFLAPARDDPTLLPLLFQNVGIWRLHIDFLANEFPERFPDLSAATYRELIETRATRDYYAGAIFRFRSGDTTLYGFNVYVDATDDGEMLEPAEVEGIYGAIAEAFAPRPLAYSPIRPVEIEKARGWVEPGFPVYLGPGSGEEPSFEPYTMGVGYGRVRIFDLEGFVAAEERAEVGWQDIAVVDEAPPDLEETLAGLITGTRQVELSHANIRCARRGTPNAYIRSAREALAAWEGELVRLEVHAGDYLVRGVEDPAEAEIWWATHRPTAGALPVPDDEYADMPSIPDMAAAPEPLTERFGGKAANLARLYRAIGPASVVDGFAIPFHAYAEFMRTNEILYEGIEWVTYEEFLLRHTADPRFRTDPARRRALLSWFIEEAEDNGVIEQEFIHAVVDRIVDIFVDPTIGVRFRSSSNAEDLLEFPAAGLHDSTGVCAADDLDGNDSGPSLCNPEQSKERTVERALKRVWLSLWNPRAFEEREYYQIPHFEARMGVLVTLAFPDEAANGVIFTGNPTKIGDRRYVVNVQLGDASVVRPDPGVLPEKDLLAVEDGEVQEIVRVRRSTLVESDEWVLTDRRLRELGALIATVEASFPLDLGEYPPERVILDLEFKLTKSEQPDGGELVLKQIRPFLIPESEGGEPLQRFAIEIPEGTQACMVFYESRPIREEYEAHAVIDFQPGVHVLERDFEEFDIDLIRGIQVGPERIAGEPIGSGHMTLLSFASQDDPEDKYFVYTYTQSFDIEGRTYDVVWDYISFHVEDGVADEIAKRIDEAYLTYELYLKASFRDTVRWHYFSSPTYALLPLFHVRADLAGGDVIEFRYRFFELLANTGPASTIAGEVTLGAETRVTSDYWHLAYAAIHHNWAPQFWIILDPPIGDVHGVWIAEPFPEGSLPTIRTLGADLEPLAELTVESYETTRLQDPVNPHFERGDLNGDGEALLDDALAILDVLFAGRALDCPDAADANDDGTINVADPIRLMMALFGGAEDLPEPVWRCGADLTEDSLPPCVYDVQICW
ncbi:MAG: hypothetical protein JXP34_25945 [Planctomycetes bacterium]|nr:hypothetical protein [Planctomycetota bacterium]